MHGTAAAPLLRLRLLRLLRMILRVLLRLRSRCLRMFACFRCDDLRRAWAFRTLLKRRRGAYDTVGVVIANWPWLG
jgi:hypothetical protein